MAICSSRNRTPARARSGALLLVLMVTLWTVPAPAVCGVEPGPPAGGPEDPVQGALIVRGPEGMTVPIPVEQTSIRASVIGVMASVEVEQVFTNSAAETIEAVYIFPLPSEAAVADMRMVVGDRTIRSEARTRQEATAHYETAKREGRQAALVEQERPNIFTSSVSNIRPGDKIKVQIRYVQALPYDDGSFRLTIPLVVAPRYLPKPAPREAGAQAADAKRITPPVLRPGMRVGHNVRIAVDLDPGLAVRNLGSPSHEVTVARGENDRYHVELKNADEIPNRDFVLTYRAAGDTPRATLLAARAEDGQTYFMLVAMPPADAFHGGVIPKEMIFVVDTSGSMQGTSIVEARNALHALIHGINANDTFNVVRFSSDFSTFSPTSLPFTQENVDRVDAFIDGLVANGGTEARPAIEYALDQPRDAHRLRIVVFVTDGQIGNEDEMLAMLQKKLGASRLFTFGIGSAPNEYLARKMAELGRGTSEFIAAGESIEDTIARFQNRVAAPVLTDLRVVLTGTRANDLSPQPVPDLFAAKPLVMFGRADKSSSWGVSLEANAAAGKTSIPVAAHVVTDRDAETLASLWARARIGTLSDTLVKTPDDKAAIAEMTDLGLRYRLLTRFTSLVAVEERRVVPAGGGPARTVTVPVPLPAGWEHGSVVDKQQEQDHRGMIASGTAGGGGGGQNRMLRMNPSPAPSAQPSGNDPFYRKPPSVKSVSPRPSRPVRVPSPGPTAANAPTGYMSVAGEKEESESIALSSPAERRSAADRFLLRNQTVTGIWADRGASTPENEVETTALVLLSAMGKGNTDRAGSYQAQVSRALQALESRVGPDGAVKGVLSIRVQALALLALSEAAAATGAARYRDAAARLASHLALARLGTGAWPIVPNARSMSADASSTAWAALALSAARKAGVPVDASIFTRAADVLAADPNAASPAAVALTAALAGRPVSDPVRARLTGAITQKQTPTPERLDEWALTLLAARQIDSSFAAELSKASSQALDPSQQANGKGAGAFAIVPGQPVASTARAEFVIGAANAAWQAVPAR